MKGLAYGTRLLGEVDHRFTHIVNRRRLDGQAQVLRKVTQLDTAFDQKWQMVIGIKDSGLAVPAGIWPIDRDREAALSRQPHQFFSDPLALSVTDGEGAAAFERL